MPKEIAGWPLWTLITVTIVGGLLVILVILYVVIWGIARAYRNKHNLHGDKKDYEDVVVTKEKPKEENKYENEKK